MEHSRSIKNITFFLALFALSSCRPSYFTAPDFQSKTAEHKTVAVLPFEMVFTGKLPKKMDEASKMQQEEIESQAFQLSLQNQLLRKANRKRKHIPIEFQSAMKTNSILKENGISIRESWTADPQKLATILGVDAVVRARVEKTRFMSDLASFGIDLGTQILFDLGAPNGIVIPGNVNKTNDIKAEAVVINKTDGGILWKDYYKRESDWNTKSNDVVEHLNRKFSRKFPYRKNRNA